MRAPNPQRKAGGQVAKAAAAAAAELTTAAAMGKALLERF